MSKFNTGDKVKITRKGMFLGLEGEIVSITYNVKLGLMGVWSFQDNEIIDTSKENVPQGLKTAKDKLTKALDITETITNVVDAISDGAKLDDILKLEPKQKFVKTKPTAEKPKRKYTKKTTKK